MPPIPLVTYTRGALAESTHYGSVAVAQPDGSLVAFAGDPQRLTTMRSSAKPFQAMVVVATGAAERFQMTPQELAVIAGSHSGQLMHTMTVAGLLSRAGLGPGSLQCGVHAPYHEPTARELLRRGEAPTALHHNCSGKHCGMLCACVAAGWDTTTYPEPDHPLQRAILAELVRMARLSRAQVQTATDGCGVPTFAVPLASFARAFALLATPETLNGDQRDSSTRVRDAMLMHPEMVGGDDRFDTDLMRAAHGRVLTKAGAEACHGAAVLGQQLGIAVKIEDGSARAAPIVVCEVLRQLGVLGEDELAAVERYAHPLVRSPRGEVSGAGMPVFELTLVRG